MKELKETQSTGVYRDHKDRLFRMVFREKKELLELYNAVNDTAYTNPDELEIVTLENAVYMNMKNDLALVLDFYMNLYEHQSTYNPNIPLRDLYYIASELRGWVKGRALYGRKAIKIPTPRFFVFYNGKDMQPERQVLKLSDAFLNPESEPALELKVVMLNINLGKNKELMERCHTLLEYAQFVAKLRKYSEDMERKEAVERVVDECIKEGILKDFLIKYREEAIEMCIFEYDEEETLRQIGEDKFAEGRLEGKREGRLEARVQLICKKLRKGKSPEIIAEELEAELSEILSICETAKMCAPEYDWEEVCEKLLIAGGQEERVETLKQ